MPKNQAKGEGNEGQNHTNFGSINVIDVYEGRVKNRMKDSGNCLLEERWGCFETKG